MNRVIAMSVNYEYEENPYPETDCKPIESSFLISKGKYSKL